MPPQQSHAMCSVGVAPLPCPRRPAARFQGGRSCNNHRRRLVSSNRRLPCHCQGACKGRLHRRRRRLCRSSRFPSRRLQEGQGQDHSQQGQPGHRRFPSKRLRKHRAPAKQRRPVLAAGAQFHVSQAVHRRCRSQLFSQLFSRLFRLRPPPRQPCQRLRPWARRQRQRQLSPIGKGWQMRR